VTRASSNNTSLSPSPVKATKASIVRCLVEDDDDDIPTVQAKVKERNIQETQWGVQHVVGGVVVGCFALPFIPVLIILSLACLPAIFFATFVCIVSAFLPMILPSNWPSVPAITEGGIYRNISGTLSLLSGLLQSTAKMGTRSAIESPTWKKKKRPNDNIYICDRPRRDQFILIFDAFDLNDSGSLNLEEITTVGKALRGSDGWTDVRSVELLQKCGKNRDGSLNADEFCSFLDHQTNKMEKEQVDNYVRRWVSAATRARTPEKVSRSQMLPSQGSAFVQKPLPTSKYSYSFNS